MKHISINMDDETIRQMKELAEKWGLPNERYNTAVVSRCVERVWSQEIGISEPKDGKTIFPD